MIVDCGDDRRDSPWLERKAHGADSLRGDATAGLRRQVDTPVQRIATGLDVAPQHLCQRQVRQDDPALHRVVPTLLCAKARSQVGGGLAGTTQLQVADAREACQCAVIERAVAGLEPSRLVADCRNAWSACRASPLRACISAQMAMARARTLGLLP